MMISRLNFGRLLFFFVILFWSRFSSADSLPRVILVIAPGLTAADLDNPDPAFRALKPSAVGWMLCRTARTAERTEPLAAQFLTLGSGSRAAVPSSVLPKGVLPANAVQKIGQGGGLKPEILTQIQAANAKLDHTVSIGALGDLLHRAGKHTTLFGDLETLTPDLSPFLFVMDSSGKVDRWTPQITRLSWDPSFSFGELQPYGIKTILDQLKGLTDSALTVIVYGDLDRADCYRRYCLPEVAARHRRTALDNLHTLLRMIRRDDYNQDVTKLILLSTAPAESITNRYDRITPIRIYGGDKGILTSASTRRNGLVLNTDLLPSLATWLNLPSPKNTLGRPMSVVPAAITPQIEKALHAEFTNTAQKQNAFGGLPTVQLLLILSAVIAISRQKFLLARGLATGVIALPLLLFLLPLIAPQSVALSGALLAVLLLLVMIIGAKKSIAWTVCLLLTVGIVLDLRNGSLLLKQGWMSYSVMEGARFYGIGNEYMGAVIGAFCVLIGLTKTESTRAFWAIMALFGMTTLIMGLPQFGAKVGAIPSAGATLGVMLMVRKTGAIRLKHLALLLGILVAGLVALALWDMRHVAEGQSHFARAVSGSGGGSLMQIALRKLTMEGTLLLRSPWSLTLWASAIGFLFLRSRLPNLSANAKIACSGIVAGAVASLLVNDAGVLAAALILLYGTAFLCLITVTETPEAPKPNDLIAQ